MTIKPSLIAVDLKIFAVRPIYSGYSINLILGVYIHNNFHAPCLDLEYSQVY
ncbi:hypothetical protein PMIT1342_00330 [Prochlorococcus marinus str. MIT 1342]|nr:hypothetical protein PMIT1342_00330 [Prochlorococcus marinus str. MIT 1342]